MAKTVKKLSAMTTVNAVNDNQKIPLTDANGKVTLISLADLKKSLLGGMNLDQMNDNVFIMYHQKSNDFPYAVKPRKWKSLENAGEIAEGVVIIDGGHVLVVAPTEAESVLPWSSADISCGATTTSDRLVAFQDWNGKQNTAAIIKASKPDAITNTIQYAPGFCNLYSRTNANGKGLTAGKWWLPSVAELMLMYAHQDKINYALSLIKGAKPISESWYWASTEFSASYAWLLNFGSGGVDGWVAKVTDRLMVRPVSAFIV